MRLNESRWSGLVADDGPIAGRGRRNVGRSAWTGGSAVVGVPAESTPRGFDCRCLTDRTGWVAGWWLLGYFRQCAGHR